MDAHLDIQLLGDFRLVYVNISWKIPPGRRVDSLGAQVRYEHSIG
jgi:hypothetical protein